VGRAEQIVDEVWDTGTALAELSRSHEAIADLRGAVELARPSVPITHTSPEK